MTPRIPVVRQHKNNLLVIPFPAFFTSGLLFLKKKNPTAVFRVRLSRCHRRYSQMFRLLVWSDTGSESLSCTCVFVCSGKTVLKRHGCSEVLCPRGANIRSNKSFEHSGTCWIRVSALPQAELVCLVGPDPDVLWFEGAETVWSRCGLLITVSEDTFGLFALAFLWPLERHFV